MHPSQLLAMLSQARNEPLYMHPDYVSRLKPKASVDQELPDANLLEDMLVQRRGRTAVVTVDDVLIDRGSFWWGLPMNALGNLIQRLAGDKTVSSILLDIDCPGGMCQGAQDLWSKVRAAGEQKPVFGIANNLAASGALYLISAADKKFVTPDGLIGSHGVVVDYFDQEGLLEKLGLKYDPITSTEFKREVKLGPLSDSARERLQSVVDQYHAKFTKALSKGYGMPPKQVENNFGRGRLLTAEEARDAGIVDGIATFDEVLGKLATRGKGGRSGTRAGASAKTRRRRLDLNEAY